MTEILSDTDVLQDALDDLETTSLPGLVRPELPDHVDENNRAILSELYLTDDTIEELRNSGNNTEQYRFYLIWRRGAVVRLHANGYTTRETADILGISHAAAATDLGKVKKAYEGASKRDWTLVVEERLLSIDSDIYELRRLKDTIGADIDLKLRILDRVDRLEARRDKLLGLDRAAASTFESTNNLKVTLSFDNHEQRAALPDGVIDVEYEEL